MPLITFACPACQKVLKSATPIAAGTRVKCPTCGASFSMGAEGAASAAPPSAGGPAPPALAGRPRSRGVRIAALAVAALALAGLGVATYWLLTGGGVTGEAAREKDPLAYVPPGAEFVAGADFPVLLDDPLVGPSVEHALREQARAGDLLDRCQQLTGLSARELLGHALLADQLATLEAALPTGLPLGGPGRPAFAGAIAPPSPMVLILKTLRPFDPERVARAARSATPKTVHGKTYYEVSEGDLRTLYMPSDHLIILSALPASQLDAVFRSDGVTPSLSPDVLALVRSVEARPSWVVVPVEGATRSRLEGATTKGRSLTDSLAKSKGVTVWGAPDGDQLTFGAEVVCAGAADATRAAAEAESAWKQREKERALLGLMLVGMPNTGKAYRELTGSVRITAEGATARATARVSRQSVADAAEELQDPRRAGGLLGGFPGMLPKPGRGGKSR